MKILKDKKLKKFILIFLISLLCIEYSFINLIKADSATGLPVTSIELLGNKAANGFYYGNVQFKLTAQDADGIATTQYKLSSKDNWSKYTSPVTLSPGKAYEIVYRSTDNLGNVELQKTARITVKTDTIPPISEAVISNEASESGFYNTPVQVHLQATDYHSGIQKIEYSINNGGTWIEYNSSVEIANNGQTIMLYRATDNSGNIEKNRRLKINIDLIAPSLPSIVFDPIEWTNESVLVMINDGEDDGSGSKKSQYKLGEGNWIDYTAPFLVTEAVIIQARTIDYAGNISEIMSSKVKIDTTNPPAPIVNTMDWSLEPVIVDITKEEDSESLVRKIQYKVGSNEEWLDYYDIFQVNEEGITSVRARSIDWAGNISDESEGLVKIDYTPPSEPTINLSHTTWTNQDVVVQIADGLDLLSGTMKSQFKIGDNGVWTDYTNEIVYYEEGATTIYARSIDYMGI